MDKHIHHCSIPSLLPQQESAKNSAEFVVWQEMYVKVTPKLASEIKPKINKYSSDL
jgi:hypothetical protein